MIATIADNTQEAEVICYLVKVNYKLYSDIGSWKQFL